MRLYFIRHGESEANVALQFSNQNYEIHPLTDKGRQQAQALSDKLRNIPFTAIYASPMLRTRQTAEIINAPHSLEIQLMPAIREHDAGDLEGRADLAAWKQYEGLYESWFVKRDPEARIINGESFTDLRTRFDPFLAALISKYGGTDSNILIVAHAGILHAMLPSTLANVSPLFGSMHILGNTALVIAEFHDGVLTCLEWDRVKLSPKGEILEYEGNS